MSSRSSGQVLFALALLIANTVYGSQILQMSRPFETGEPGPSFLPIILCVFIYAAVGRMLFLELRKPSRVVADAAADESDHVPHVRTMGPIFAIGLSALFIIGFFYVGYLLSALIYTTLISAGFNYEQRGKIGRAALVGLATGSCVTLFGWLFFVKLFGLYLPLWEL